MGKPTPAPPPNLTAEESASYIDPGYELLEKVYRIRATPRAIADLADTISLPNLHDAGLWLHQDEHRSLLPSPVRHRQEEHLQHCHYGDPSCPRPMVADIHPLDHLSMRFPYLGELGFQRGPTGIVSCRVYKRVWTDRLGSDP